MPSSAPHKQSGYISAVRLGIQPGLMTVGALTSLALHGLFFVVLVFFPDFSPTSDIRTDVIRVRMVSAAPGPGAADLGPETSIQSPEQPSAPSENKQPTEDITKNTIKTVPETKPAPEQSSVPKVYKKKVSMKKKTFNREKVVKKAIDRLEKTSEANRPKTVADAISRLKDKVKGMTPPAAGNNTGSPGAGVAAGNGAGQGGRALEAMDIYKAEIAYQIQRNWAYPGRLDPEGKEMEAVLVIRILPSGRIGDIRFHKRSGNELLDDSSFKAVQKSNPLPKPPEAIGNGSYELGLRFTPKGLN